MNHHSNRPEWHVWCTIVCLLALAVTACDNTSAKSQEQEKPESTRAGEPDKPDSSEPIALRPAETTQAEKEDVVSEGDTSPPIKACGHPVCEDELVALLPAELGELKLIRKFTQTEIIKEKKLPTARVGPPEIAATGWYSPTGTEREGELRVNVFVQFAHKEAYMPIEVTRQPVGSVEDNEIHGGHQVWFEVSGGHKALRTTWTEPDGRQTTELMVVLGPLIVLKAEVRNDHDPEAIHALLNELPLDAWAALYSPPTNAE